MSSANRKERKNLRLASLGATLEYYDFVAYVYVASAISQAFFPEGSSETLRLVQTFGIYSIGFVARPVAGIFMSRLADRIGRKKIFIFTLGLMSAATFGIGVLPTYETVGWLAPMLLLLMRVLQGCAVGGELPAAAVFVSEFAGPSRVGYAGAYLQSLAYGGFLMGASAAYVANFLADNIWTGSPSLEWRLPFIIGGVLGVVALYFRRELDETPAFRELEEQVGPQGSERQGSLSAVLREHRPAVMFGFLLIGTLSIINIVFFQYWPTYLQVNLGHSANMALSSSLLAIIGAMIAIPLWGRFADRYGWRALFVCGAVASMISSIAAFSVLPSIATDSPLLLVVSLPAAIGVASLAGAVPGLLASLFPTAIRQSGYAIPYNVGVAVVAGLLPLSLAPLIDTVGVRAPLLLALFSCALLLVAAAWVTRIPLYLGRSTIATDTEIVDDHEVLN
ncbi:MFS transporter [Rhodococcus sp. IEGM 1307]|uniref:MFS transporter n=1 Tax=Rhodococcus sp. IEGM 1307 TaxID=3047091 RepID=UPI0024B69369|nr:MFS transporter [Rhodococcus sp. IEGM 1307]MDI9977386.1 MFS transporter [Rhodococcus sp. IEGM 1307]